MCTRSSEYSILGADEDESLDKGQVTPQPSPSLGRLLEEASDQVRRVGEAFSKDASELALLRQRLAEGRFHLAVLGQFKRGKSTLLNALLGDSVLPTSVVPLTAIPTFVYAGSPMRTRVIYEGDRRPQEFAASEAQQLAQILLNFVSETGNPRNRLGVAQVEVFYSAPILRNGVVLIDTPGIGSTFRHNTETALNFLPQCDAALFLVSADPPITEVEVEFLRRVRDKVPRLFFIVNKVDYLNEEDRRITVQFFRRVLREQVGIGDEAAIFCVSARSGLKARLTPDPILWRESGLAHVEEHLIDFLAREKAAALASALTRKAGDVLGDVVMRLRLDVRSRQMPLAQLQERLEIFERKLGEIEQERIVARDLLTGSQKRMHEFLEEHAEQLRKKARSYLEGIVKERLAASATPGEEALRETLAEAIPGFFEHESGQTTEMFQKKMAGELNPHQERADALIETVRRTAAELFDVPYRAPQATGAFEMVQKPYWTTHNWSYMLNPLPVGLIEKLLPAGARQARILKRINEQVGALVMSNVEDLRWAVFQGLDQTFLRFGNRLDQRLTDTIAATHGAIHAALAQRKERSESVAGQVSRLQSADAALTTIIHQLERI